MEADSDIDHDSTFGGDRDSILSSTASLRSEVTRYQFEHGRRYHGFQAGKHLFPNDEIELNRMDIEHHAMLLQIDGKLHLAPLENPKEILDLGCGTGIWALDMADRYPDAQVLGIDLSPIQPNWVPTNCRFEVDDFELDWTFGENRFDFIHERFLVGSVSSFPELFKKAHAALKPGGWFELTETECPTFCDDGTLPEDSALNQWARWQDEAWAKIGRPFPPSEVYHQMLEDVGFVNVRSEIFKRPTNDWPKDPKMKEIGRFCCLNLLEGVEGFTLGPFTRVLGWKPEEVQILLAQFRKEMLNRRIHGYGKSARCFAQKPFTAS